MSFKVEGIPITATTILNAYKMWYPEVYRDIVSENKFKYLYLWGIRVSTCDTSLPDDLVGGIRVNNLNMAEIIVSSATTDPTPKSLQKLHDSEARAKGGTAFVMEGTHPYKYLRPSQVPQSWKPFPAFPPRSLIPVYRWNPSQADIKLWEQGKRSLSASFDAALRSGNVKRSNSSDTAIHRTWWKDKLFGDSAGCQALTDHQALVKLGQWAEEHLKMKYPNMMSYTLFNKSQFVAANTSQPRTSTTDPKRPPAPSQPSQGFFWSLIQQLFGK
jgi:hypothetical protein